MLAVQSLAWLDSFDAFSPSVNVISSSKPNQHETGTKRTGVRARGGSKITTTKPSNVLLRSLNNSIEMMVRKRLWMMRSIAPPSLPLPQTRHKNKQ
jgi:hypothetical protein